jgi:hypothetical protein
MIPKTLCAALLVPALLSAQSAPVPDGSRGFVSTGVSFQQWSFEDIDEPLRETVFPLAAHLPVSPNAFLNVTSTPGSARYDTLTLGGFSDTWIRGTVVLPGGRTMLHAAVGAPTGKVGLDAGEFFLSQALGENIFRFRLPVFGQGLSGRIGAATAVPVGEKAVFGAGFHFIAKSAYKPLEADSIEYRAGNEAAGFAGVDVALGPEARWSLNVSYTFYGKDALNGTEVFAAGGKFLVATSLNARLGPGLLSAALAWRQRGRNEYWVATGLEAEDKNSNGPQTELDAAWQVPWGPRARVSLLGTGRFYGENGYGLGGAAVTGGGAGLAAAVSPKATVQVNALFLSGSMKQPKSDLGLSGIDVSAGVTFGL